MKRFLSLISFIGILSACTAQGSVSVNPSASPGSSASPSASPAPIASSGTSASGVIEAKNLTRTQFIKAMECAQAKGGSNAYLFASQMVVKTAFTDEAFAQIMALGGGGQYVAYKAAVEIGCDGR